MLATSGKIAYILSWIGIVFYPFGIMAYVKCVT